jgi:DNA-binding LacI/PurR family transcriptional regulator
LATAPNRIGYIAGWEGASTQRDREFGFRQRLAEDGRDIDLRTIGNFHMDSARQATLEMFDRGDPPDAIFVANDHMAFAVMDTLRFELGLSVPHDVSVVGYDDVPTAAWRAYDLTTVRQPVNQMVARTVETLLRQIDDPDSTPSRVALDGPLIIRRSVRLPEGWTNETLCE